MSVRLVTASRAISHGEAVISGFLSGSLEKWSEANSAPRRTRVVNGMMREIREKMEDLGRERKEIWVREVRG